MPATKKLQFENRSIDRRILGDIFKNQCSRYQNLFKRSSFARNVKNYFEKISTQKQLVLKTIICH